MSSLIDFGDTVFGLSRSRWDDNLQFQMWNHAFWVQCQNPGIVVVYSLNSVMQTERLVNGQSIFLTIGKHIRKIWCCELTWHSIGGVNERKSTTHIVRPFSSLCRSGVFITFRDGTQWQLSSYSDITHVICSGLGRSIPSLLIDCYELNIYLMTPDKSTSLVGDKAQTRIPCVQHTTIE